MTTRSRRASSAGTAILQVHNDDDVTSTAVTARIGTPLPVHRRKGKARLAQVCKNTPFRKIPKAKRPSKLQQSMTAAQVQAQLKRQSSQPEKRASEQRNSVERQPQQQQPQEEQEATFTDEHANQTQEEEPATPEPTSTPMRALRGEATGLVAQSLATAQLHVSDAETGEEDEKDATNSGSGTGDSDAVCDESSANGSFVIASKTFESAMDDSYDTDAVVDSSDSSSCNGSILQREHQQHSQESNASPHQHTRGALPFSPHPLQKALDGAMSRLTEAMHEPRAAIPDAVTPGPFRTRRVPVSQLMSTPATGAPPRSTPMQPSGKRKHAPGTEEHEDGDSTAPHMVQPETPAHSSTANRAWSAVVSRARSILAMVSSRSPLGGDTPAKKPKTNANPVIVVEDVNVHTPAKPLRQSEKSFTTVATSPFPATMRGLSSTSPSVSVTPSQASPACAVINAATTRSTDAGTSPLKLTHQVAVASQGVNTSAMADATAPEMVSAATSPIKFNAPNSPSSTNAEAAVEGLADLSPTQLLRQAEVMAISNEILRDKLGAAEEEAGKHASSLSQKCALVESLQKDLAALKQTLEASEDESETTIFNLQQSLADALMEADSLKPLAERAAHVSTELAEARSELESLLLSNDSLQSAYAALQAEAADYKAAEKERTAEMRAAISRLEETLAAKESDIDTFKDAISALEEEQELLEKSANERVAALTAAKAKLEEDITHMYRQHKKALTELEEKYQVNDFDERMGELVSDNQRLSAELSTMAEARGALVASTEASAEAVAWANETIAKYNDQLKALKEEKLRAAQARAVAEADIDGMKAELGQLRASKAQLKDQLHATQQQLEEEQFKLDEASAEAMTSAETIADLTSQLTTLREQHTTLIQEHEKTQEALASQEKSVAASEEALTALRAELATQESALLAEISAVKDKLLRTDAERRALAEKKIELTAEAEHMKDELLEKDRALSRVQRACEESEKQYADLHDFMRSERDAEEQANALLSRNYEDAKETIAALEQEIEAMNAAHGEAVTTLTAEAQEKVDMLSKEKEEQVAALSAAMEQATAESASLKEKLFDYEITLHGVQEENKGLKDMGKWKAKYEKMKAFMEQYKQQAEAKIKQLKVNLARAEKEVVKLDLKLRVSSAENKSMFS